MNQPTNDPRSPYFDGALDQLGRAVHEFKRAESALDYAAKIARQLAKTQEQLRYIDKQLAPLNRIP
jgi:hypothetical protein